MKINSKSTVGDVMRMLDRHMSDGWRTVSKADFDMTENMLLLEDMKYIAEFVCFLHTEEIRKLAYSSLKAAAIHMDKTVYHIHLWSRWFKTHGGRQQIDKLSINILAAYSEEPPTMERLYETLDKIKTIQEAFEGDLMLGDDVNERLVNYVADCMIAISKTIESATAWLQIIVEHISKCKKKGVELK